MIVRIQVILIVFLLAGCSGNHQHDGLYIADKKFMGVTRAWIVEGNGVTIYIMGTVDAVRCKQYNDRIEVSNKTYYFNPAGGIVVPGVTPNATGYTMNKVSTKTKYSFDELDKLIEDAVPPEFRR